MSFVPRGIIPPIITPFTTAGGINEPVLRRLNIYDKYMAGDIAGSLEAQFKLSPLRISTNMGTFPEVIKAGLIMQGFNVGKCLKPIAEITPEQKEKLRAVLTEMNLLQRKRVLIALALVNMIKFLLWR